MVCQLNCLLKLESNCCQCGILKVLENNALCNLLIFSQLYLGFYALRVIRDKHIMLEIGIFFTFDFSESLVVLLFDSNNRNRHFSWNILPIIIILGSLLLPL